jgi:hypothetical protein
MDAGSPALLAAAALGAFAAIAPVVFWLARGRAWSPSDPRAAARQRARRASQRGWAYDETTAGDTVFTLRGEEEGVKWKVRYRADPMRPDACPTLSWATTSVQGSVTELRVIGRARYERGSAVAEPVIEKLSSPREIALAQAHAEFVERTKPAKAGSDAFRERFVVLARNRRLARALVDDKFESLLLRWGRVSPPPEDVLSIWVDWQGLRIDVDAPWTGMREIEHLVALGLALANGYRRHAAAPGVTRWMETQPGTVV